ncbi:MAG: C4-dicarboxylate ABC transporter [Betaproteobacteria bacterium RIFCSPLOWO2_02_FULL_67_26]|nr:MAG: C4-dicarboxylate ABC transporter [Betaproteobacteria bacterium RIFCSPLOWO2_02_FULL_67_26]
MRKELWFGGTLMAVILVTVLTLTPWSGLFDGHLGKEDLGTLGLLMLALIVVAIMLGFPTAFTLMGMGVFFAWLAYYSVNPKLAVPQTLDLFVQRTYGVMSNDVLIAIPLFLFMGYLVERAQLIDRLFRSLHLATSRVPGSLAVATIVTCAIFATATGIIGAVVTLMGLLAFPAMLKAGYNVKVAAGAVTAGGCLGILLPPSVLLIVYGATAGVSVVQLYAGAFFPGIMLASLYIGYIIVLAKWRPQLMPPLAESERRVPLPPLAQTLSRQGSNPLIVLWRAFSGGAAAKHSVLAQFVVTLIPALAIVAVLGVAYRSATAPEAEASAAGLIQAGGEFAAAATSQEQDTGLIGQPAPEAEKTEPGVTEPPAEAPKELGATPAAEQPAEAGTAEPPASTAEAVTDRPAGTTQEGGATPERLPVPIWYWIVLAIGVAAITLIYRLWNWERLEVFKLLLTSFFPLAMLILAVLGSIVFGLATPAEAAAVGAFGGFVMVIAYRYIAHLRGGAGGPFSGAVIGGTLREFGTLIKESSFLTARTSAMVCWLFVGSGIFSAAFALLGGQELLEKWVLSLDLTPVQFMLLAQFIIFILGWPLEWTEIIIIFMPIFIPLLPHFNIVPLFFGLLVALNLQTAFLSPPVAMAAFYLKGVSPPHVSLNQIFAGMIPFMGWQIVAMFILYTWPQIGLWLPHTLYK